MLLYDAEIVSLNLRHLFLIFVLYVREELRLESALKLDDAYMVVGAFFLRL